MEVLIYPGITLNDSYQIMNDIDGYAGRIEKLIEESFELCEATMDMDRDHIIEEIGDVMNLISSIMIFYKINGEEVEEVMVAKMLRQMKREGVISENSSESDGSN